MACINEISDKCRHIAATDTRSTQQRSACFDCSICLESAVEPVVTLCGHLYCWPCIYKWMRVDDRDGSASSPHCPVCRAPVSENALVPLYGRGGPQTDRGPPLDVPNRPKVPMQEQPHRWDRYGSCCGSALGSTGGGVLLGLAVAMRPPVSRSGDSVGPYRYRFDTGGLSSRERRRELVVEEALHQIWIFLFFSVVLCLLFF